ncbi:hypothetical protein KKF55_06245 [Patescibacteria group bacterium]|nr:hypothetical protein [Patescibacteria group bacterium]
MDIPKLIKRVKASRLLSEKEQKYWLNKMETMNDKDLVELDGILEYAEKIDWEEAIPKYEKAVKAAGEVYTNTLTKLQVAT